MPMKLRKFPTLIASFLCLGYTASADTIVLTDGEKLEGRVVREDGDNYVVEVFVSDTIKDEKIIPKSDVSFIDKEGPDETAFGKIGEFLPTPELLGAENYKAKIEKVEKFLEEFPKSAKATKVREMLDVLNDEFDVVIEGGFKLGKEMITSGDYATNAFEYDAVIAEKRINDAINRRDFLSALRLFATYDETFVGAAGRAELVGKMKQVLTAFSATLSDSLESFDSRDAKRKAGLERMAPENRAQTELALEEEAARLNARYEQEKADRKGWVTPDTYHKASLEESRRQVESERRRLETKGTNGETETSLGEVYRVAWGELVGGTDEEKTAVIAQLKTQRMPDIYIEKLRVHAGLPGK